MAGGSRNGLEKDMAPDGSKPALLKAFSTEHSDQHLSCQGHNVMNFYIFCSLPEIHYTFSESFFVFYNLKCFNFSSQW